MKTQTEIKHVKKGKFIIIDDEPCKVVSIAISAPGKHGHAKVKLDAKNIFTGTKKSIVKPSHSKVDVPIIEKSTAQVLSVSGDTCQLMDTQTYEVFETKIPEDMVDKVQVNATVPFWTVMGKKMIKEA